MADSPYDPSQPRAVDRVRRLAYDKSATHIFPDEEIVHALGEAGFAGDPLSASPKQEMPELKAAIALVESVPSSSSSTGASTTLKLGDQTFTSSDGSVGNFDRTGILASLRRRLNALYATQSGDYGGPAVVDPYEGRCRL